VEVQYDSRQADVHFIALFPEIASLSAERSTLNNIAASDACYGRYEGAELGAPARFTAPDALAGEATATVDVAQRLLSKLRVSSGSEFATIQGARVVGTSADTATIAVDGFSASVDVVVGDDVVTPTITPIVLDDSIQPSASQEYHVSGSPTVTSEAQNCDFNREGDVGYVYHFAEFSSYGEALPASSIELTAFAAAGAVGITSSTSLVVPLGAIGLDCAVAVQTQWLLDSSQALPQCTGGSLVGSNTMLVDLPGVCRVDFTMTSDRVAPDGDIAPRYPYNYPSSVTVTPVIASYCEEDGTTLLCTSEMVSDSRTTFGLNAAQSVVSTNGVYTASAATGSAQVVVSFGSVSSDPQLLTVVGHRAGILPEPCSATIALTSDELSQASGYSGQPPFNLRASSTVQTVSVAFCTPDTDPPEPEAVNGNATWPVLLGGNLVTLSGGVVNVGLAFETTNGNVGPAASPTYDLVPASDSGCSPLLATFDVNFAAASVVAAVTVDVMRYETTTAGEWCVTNDDSNRYCKCLCDANLTWDVGEIAFLDTMATRPPFNCYDRATVSSYEVDFSSASSCTGASETFDMKRDSRADYTPSGNLDFYPGSLQVAAKSDSSSVESLSATLTDGGINAHDSFQVVIVAFGNAFMSLSIQTDGAAAAACSPTASSSWWAAATSTSGPACPRSSPSTRAAWRPRRRSTPPSRPSPAATPPAWRWTGRPPRARRPDLESRLRAAATARSPPSRSQSSRRTWRLWTCSSCRSPASSARVCRAPARSATPPRATTTASAASACSPTSLSAMAQRTTSWAAPWCAKWTPRTCSASP
jgi:hypothetical protein